MKTTPKKHTNGEIVRTKTHRYTSNIKTQMSMNVEKVANLKKYFLFCTDMLKKYLLIQYYMLNMDRSGLRNMLFIKPLIFLRIQKDLKTFLQTKPTSERVYHLLKYLKYSYRKRTSSSVVCNSCRASKRRSI